MKSFISMYMNETFLIVWPIITLVLVGNKRPCVSLKSYSDQPVGYGGRTDVILELFRNNSIISKNESFLRRLWLKT